MINYSAEKKSFLVEIQETLPQQRIHNYFHGLQAALNTILPLEVAKVVELIIQAGERKSTIFICGNGGSAATASHMACDLAKGTRVEGIRPFRAISLTDSLPQLTAWANDTSYENCFSGQLEGLGQEDDLLIAISGSGNSPNVLKAITTAKKLGMITVGLAGFKGGKMAGLVDHCLIVPADNIEQVEDAHLALEHAICTTVRYGLQDLKVA